MTVSAEGRVENQKLNQTAAPLSFGWVFGFQLDLLEKNLTTLLGFTFTLIVQIMMTLFWVKLSPAKVTKFFSILNREEYDVISGRPYC